MKKLLEYQKLIKKLDTEALLDELLKYHYWKDRVLLLKLEILSRTESKNE